LAFWSATAWQASAGAATRGGRTFFPDLTVSSPTTKPPPASLGALTDAPPACADLFSAIETAIGAVETDRSSTMATIGTFTRRGDTLHGAIRTLSLDVELDIRKAEKSSDNAPDYRIFASGTGRGRDGADSELGAAWQKTSAQQRDYLSVKIDDPALAGPLFATLVEDAGDPDGGRFNLIWTRS